MREMASATAYILYRTLGALSPPRRFENTLRLGLTFFDFANLAVSQPKSTCTYDIISLQGVRHFAAGARRARAPQRL